MHKAARAPARGMAPLTNVLGTLWHHLCETTLLGASENHSASPMGRAGARAAPSA